MTSTPPTTCEQRSDSRSAFRMRTHPRRSLCHSLATASCPMRTAGMLPRFATFSARAVVGSISPYGEMDPTTARALKVANLGSIPAVLIGQLAVAREWQSERRGCVLMRKALRESLRCSHVVGGVLVITDPVDATASAFYEKFGFIRLAPDAVRLYLSMK